MKPQAPETHPSAIVGRHISPETAVDIARNLMPAKEDPAVQDHLASCPGCLAQVSTLSSFAALARADRQLAPPEDVVARVRALAEARRPVSALTRIKAALSYDGAWQPAPAGVRGETLPEQVAYEAEGVALDFRVNRDPARKMVIVGQLTDKGHTRRLAQVPVMLVQGDDVKVRTQSNEWGEFHIEHPDRARLRLEVALEGGRTISIPLRNKRRPS